MLDFENIWNQYALFYQMKVTRLSLCLAHLPIVIRNRKIAFLFLMTTIYLNIPAALIIKLVLRGWQPGFSVTVIIFFFHFYKQLIVHFRNEIIFSSSILRNPVALSLFCLLSVNFLTQNFWTSNLFQLRYEYLRCKVPLSRSYYWINVNGPNPFRCRRPLLYLSYDIIWLWCQGGKGCKPFL